MAKNGIKTWNLIMMGKSLVKCTPSFMVDIDVRAHKDDIQGRIIISWLNNMENHDHFIQ